MSTQQLTTKYQDFDPNDLFFTEFEENERSKDQNIGYPRYKQDKQALMLQGPWIKMNAYGVPQLGEYYKTDKDRAFIKIPFDLTNPEANDFYQKMKAIDSMMSSKETMTRLFKSKASKYRYIPICREPQETEDEPVDDKKNKYPRPPYMKVKLDVTWPEIGVKTQVFTSILKDGKREREKQDVNSVDDFANVVRFMSSIRPIIRPVKGWCEKKVRLGNDSMQYGVTFKLVKVEVEPSESGNNSLITQYMNNDAFVDSDDEESTFHGIPAKMELPKSTALSKLVKTAVPSKPVVKDDSDSDHGEESDEEEEEEVEEEEEEEEDEPEPEPVPPKKATKSKTPEVKPTGRKTKNV